MLRRLKVPFKERTSLLAVLTFLVIATPTLISRPILFNDELQKETPSFQPGISTSPSKPLYTIVVPSESRNASHSSQFNEAASFEPPTPPLQPKPQPRLPRVTIWSPPPCNGSFVSQRAPHSKDGVPYLIIREAVIDRRPVSYRQYREVHQKNSFLRIILYLSVHLSVDPTHHNANVSLLTSGNQPVPGTAIRMDYVQQVDPFLIKRPYKPGTVTRRGHHVSEWQVALSLAPDDSMYQHEFDDHVQMLSTAGSKVSLEMFLIRFDDAKITFKTSFDLNCAIAWEYPDVFPSLERLRRPTCHTDVQNSTGAVLVSGSALYGKKKKDPQYYVEVAHFAARALGGPTRFDTVAMGVVVNNSVSDRQLCKEETCVADMNRKNEQLLESVRRVVEEELDKVGLNRSLWSNLLIVPMCRLGSDASKTEFADVCRLSHQYGQYHATFFTYTMLAPYFKWAASYDMDEFFAKPQSKPLQSETADKVLDEVGNGEMNDMTFTWLAILVKQNKSRSLTKDLLNWRAVGLRHRNGDKEFDCLQPIKGQPGKSVVRCDIGVGFTIHRPVIRDVGVPWGILGQRQGKIWVTQLRTWHARLLGSSGQCMYVEGNETVAQTK